MVEQFKASRIRSLGDIECGLLDRRTGIVSMSYIKVRDGIVEMENVGTNMGKAIARIILIGIVREDFVRKRLVAECLRLLAFKFTEGGRITVVNPRNDEWRCPFEIDRLQCLLVRLQHRGPALAVVESVRLPDICGQLEIWISDLSAVGERLSVMAHGSPKGFMLQDNQRTELMGL